MRQPAEGTPLTIQQRRAIEAHIRRGVMTAEGMAALRMLRRRLKRKVRERVGRFVWLA